MVCRVGWILAGLCKLLGCQNHARTAPRIGRAETGWMTPVQSLPDCFLFLFLFFYYRPLPQKRLSRGETCNLSKAERDGMNRRERKKRRSPKYLLFLDLPISVSHVIQVTLLESLGFFPVCLHDSVPSPDHVCISRTIPVPLLCMDLRQLKPVSVQDPTAVS